MAIAVHTTLHAQEKGYCFVIDGRHEVHFGSLTIVSADNPASCALGGFKETTAAHRMCTVFINSRRVFRKGKVFIVVHTLR